MKIKEFGVQAVCMVSDFLKDLVRGVPVDIRSGFVKSLFQRVLGHFFLDLILSEGS